MNFENAFNAAFDQEQLKQQPNVKFAIKKETFKTLAFFWNMVALADGNFDDIVFIDANTNIISEPLKKQKKEKIITTTKKRGRKKSSAKTADNKDVLNDDNSTGNEAS